MSWVWRYVCGIAMLSACGDNTIGANAGDSRVLRESIPVLSNDNMDILFVIDNSPAMAPFATKLAANERELIKLLTPMFGPDLHLGVVTSDPGDAGKLRRIPGITNDFLSTAIQFDFSVRTNAAGDLADAFVALADVGSTGSTSPQPLAMAVAALAPGTNPGFRRDGALLGTVFITASDDNSPGNVADYATTIKQYVSDNPTNVAVSIATGPCNSSSLSAPDAPRLGSFAAQFQNRSTRIAVCDDSLAALVDIDFQLIKTPLGLQCIDVPLTTPPECSFWLERQETLEQRIIEPCPSVSIPCWEIAPEPQCAEEPHIASRLVPGIRAEPGVTEELECVVE